MNIRTRVQVDGFVTGVSRRLVYYPACDSCAGKLTILQDNSKAVWSTYWCKRCSDAVEEKNVHYRYCLVLTVSDKSSVANVTAFGNGWDKLFGVTATDLHKVLKKFAVQNTCEVVNQCFHDSIIAAFVGCRFNFKFNVCLTKAIPRGSLSFKTLTNSIMQHEHKNLIATNFTMEKVEHFKTVLNILEEKLLFKNSRSDITITQQSILHHHDNNSYLYGSWLSDTASQEMYLVSLNDKHCSNSRPSTQCSLVDSVYWQWEQTLTDKLEEEKIISDVVDHLELSKNEFLTSDDNCTVMPELYSVDSEDLDVYNESFIKHFFSTQNVEGLHGMIVEATTTGNQGTLTPTATYNCSPEMFSVRKHSRSEAGQQVVSTPNSLPLLSVAKTSGRILFEDESLNSPCLFGEIDHGRTPVGKMNLTTDFTSPALC